MIKRRAGLAEIAAAANAILRSTTALWETAIKRGSGKLRFPDDLDDAVRQEAFVLMPIGSQYLRRLDALPSLRRDPFDRMSVAQAIAEGIPLVTNDRALLPYGIPTLW